MKSAIPQGTSLKPIPLPLPDGVDDEAEDHRDESDAAALAASPRPNTQSKMAQRISMSTAAGSRNLR